MNVTVAVLAVASPVTAVAPRPVTVGAPEAGTSTAAVRKSAAIAKSLASWLSTRSAFRPVATPVAFVVNGAPVASLVVMLPAWLPSVANSNARPVLRLFERMHGSWPVADRQP